MPFSGVAIRRRRDTFSTWRPCFRVTSSGLSQVPAWVALGMRARTRVEVDGITEPVSLGDAVRSEHWALWAEAIKKEAAGLILAGLWDEVPMSSVPADKRLIRGTESLP